MEGFPVRQLVVSLALLLAMPALADTIKLQDNAPDTYVVVKGDTLWDISARFLKDPWRWPQTLETESRRHQEPRTGNLSRRPHRARPQRKGTPTVPGQERR